MEENKREYQKVIEYVRSIISNGKAGIGSKLPTEREIAQKLSVSRNSAREALRTLENMGVTESRRGSGNYIVGNMQKPISNMIDMMLLLEQTNQSEICSFRRNLDKAVCFSLIDDNCNNENFKAIEETYGCEKYTESRKILLENDRLFHYSLITATNNKLWICIAGAIMNVYRSWIDIVLQKADKHTIAELLETHERIIETIKSNDRIQCEKWIDKHYDIVDKEMKRGLDDEI